MRQITINIQETQANRYEALFYITSNIINQRYNKTAFRSVGVNEVIIVQGYTELSDKEIIEKLNKEIVNLGKIIFNTGGKDIQVGYSSTEKNSKKILHI